MPPFFGHPGSGAASGSYSVEVGLLAQAQKRKSSAFTAASSTIGSGTLTIDFGTYSADTFTLNPDKATKTISIGSGQSSLAGIRDAVNAANAGVTAGIVNDGSGYRLTLTSRDTGAANALRVVVADSDGIHTDMSGLSQLMFDGRTSGVKNLTQSAAAQNASVTIDGIAISKASNTITDAIEGVTLNLLKPIHRHDDPHGGARAPASRKRGGEFRQGLQRRTRRSRIFPPITRRPSRRPSSGRQRRALDPVGASQLLSSALTTAGGGTTHIGHRHRVPDRRHAETG